MASHCCSGSRRRPRRPRRPTWNRQSVRQAWNFHPCSVHRADSETCRAWVTCRLGSCRQKLHAQPLACRSPARNGSWATRYRKDLLSPSCSIGEIDPPWTTMQQSGSSPAHAHLPCRPYLVAGHPTWHKAQISRRRVAGHRDARKRADEGLRATLGAMPAVVRRASRNLKWAGACLWLFVGAPRRVLVDLEFRRPHSKSRQSCSRGKR